MKEKGYRRSDIDPETRKFIEEKMIFVLKYFLILGQYYIKSSSLIFKYCQFFKDYNLKDMFMAVVYQFEFQIITQKIDSITKLTIAQLFSEWKCYKKSALFTYSAFK